MFEEFTFEYLMKRALSRVSGKVDKRQGSVIYDALAPAMAELCRAYIELDRIIEETFADTASREYLIKRARERGLSPYAATYAAVLAELTGDFKLEGGERFNLDDVNYYYTGEMEEGFYKLRCETAGEAGNNSYGSLIPIDNISGLESAEIVSLFYEGNDEEETEAFRKRYFDSFESQAFGGNIADYKEKMQALNDNQNITDGGGIGGVKVYPVWNGGGTVKLVFTTRGYNAPTDNLRDLVQNEVMPYGEDYNGVGFAPIGHNVTVEGVTEKKIDIYTELTLKDGYSVEDVYGYVENAVEDYLEGLRQTWADEDGLTIRISNIESRILDINGIIDIGGTTINEGTENFILEADEIPVRGNINVN